MLELNKIYFEDCLVGMDNIDDKSIDMILCDLPYGTIAARWDKQLPMDKLWPQYERVIKDNGSILLFGSEPFSSHLRMSNIGLYRYDWYWLKSKPGLYQHAKNRPMKKVETISVFSKAKWGHASQVQNRMLYYPQGVTSSGKKVVNKNYNAGGTVGLRPNQIGREYESFTGFPHDVLEYRNIFNNNLHPTQKPVELLEYLIKTYTMEGEVVLDNCMGSGSTAIAAFNTKRNFIGFENDPVCFETCRERLDTLNQGL